MGYCRQCGGAVQDRDRFCGACGCRVGEPAAAAPMASSAVLPTVEPPAEAESGQPGGVARVWVIPLILLCLTLGIASELEEISPVAIGFPLIMAAGVWQFGKRRFFSFSEFLFVGGRRSWGQPIAAAIVSVLVIVGLVNVSVESERRKREAVPTAAAAATDTMSNSMAPAAAAPTAAETRLSAAPTRAQRIVGTWRGDNEAVENHGSYRSRVVDVVATYAADGSFANRGAFLLTGSYGGVPLPEEGVHVWYDIAGDWRISGDQLTLVGRSYSLPEVRGWPELAPLLAQIRAQARTPFTTTYQIDRLEARSLVLRDVATGRIVRRTR